MGVGFRGGEESECRAERGNVRGLRKSEILAVK